MKNTILITLLLFLTACSNNTEKARLTIYCGITMTKPISEIANIFQKENNCEIDIIKGGSGNLLKSIELDKSGDIFLPGSNSYYK